MGSIRAAAGSGAAWVVCAVGVAACGAEDAGDFPPVVLVVVDTLRADAVLDPEERHDTPSIDALAADGTHFTQAFSHAPLTVPAHTSFFSSRPPFETGVLGNGQSIPRDLPLLADWLGEHGYARHAVVSLGVLDPGGLEGGLDRGFDSYDVDFFHIAQAKDVSRRLGAVIDELEPDEPFFLFAHFSDPHEPYNAHGALDRRAELLLDGDALDTLDLADMTLWERELPLSAGRHVFEVRSDHAFRVMIVELLRRGGLVEADWEEGAVTRPGEYVRFAVDVPFTGTYRTRLRINDEPPTEEIAGRYRGEVAYVDRYVGQVLDELKRRGLYDRSLVVFTSDHGEALGERGMFGHVQHLHDELLHVPLILKLPAGDPRAEALEALREGLVSHVDLLPTLLELIGVAPLPGQRGRSILEGRPRLLVAQTHRPDAARDSVCLRDERFKLIYEPEEERFRMFDLAADPGEETDVFEALRGERPDWPRQLESIARISLGRDREEPTDETRKLLEGLGYL